MKHTILLYIGLLIVSLLFAGCTTDDDEASDFDNYSSSALSPEYYGDFSGIWIVNDEKVGEAELQVGVRQAYTGLPLTKDMIQAIAKKLGTTALANVQGDVYTVTYQETGYSASSLYFDTMPYDYELKITAKGQQHTVKMTVESGKSVAVYDKQTTAFVALFKMSQLKVDDEVVESYQPALTVQFNSTKKTRTGGV